MSVNYSFYRPWDMKLIKSGSFVGMPFLKDNCYIKLYPDDNTNSLSFTFTTIIDRFDAEELQKNMIKNKTLFTDLMDKNATDCLIVRIT